MVTRFSVMVVLALVGPRPVRSCRSWTAAVAIFAEGVWLSCWWFTGGSFSRILGRVMAPREGEEALEPRRQRSLQPTPQRLMGGGGGRFLAAIARFGVAEPLDV